MDASGAMGPWATHAAHATLIPSTLVLSVKTYILNISVSVYHMGQVGYEWQWARKCRLHRMTRRPPFMRDIPESLSVGPACHRRFPSACDEFAAAHIFSSIPPPAPHFIPTLPLCDQKEGQDRTRGVLSQRAVCFQTDQLHWC